MARTLTSNSASGSQQTDQAFASALTTGTTGVAGALGAPRSSL
jgi:hypothetical protein